MTFPHPTAAPSARGTTRRARWARYKVTRPFSPHDLAALWGLIIGIVVLAVILGWALDMKGGTVIVLAIPFISSWFDARRILFQFDPAGVRIGNVLLPGADVTQIVVATPANGQHVLIGAQLRPGAAIPAGADVCPHDPAMPAPLHVAVEPAKFDLGKMVAKARKYAPPHIEIVVAEPGGRRTAPAHPAAGPLGPQPAAPGRPPYAMPTQPAYTPPAPDAPVAGGFGPQPGAPAPVLPAALRAHPAPTVRWGAVIGVVLTCVSALGLFAGALPLMAYQFDIAFGDTKGYHGNESAYEALGLEHFPALPDGSGLVSWPWLLLPLLAQAAVLYMAALPRRSHGVPRILGFGCALALPLRLFSSQLWWEPTVVGGPSGTVARITYFSFEGGWWLLHAGALLGLAAFVWQDIAARRRV
ncbi:hypothetical protein ACTVZO_40655 [Streptomyces sp. IBSNAI002]|uniref:hypothetical protein n=1 Tax=Streptomyces sp. IBSNAI002 TaxID=3457500 RepID=UPI003FCFCB77